jgi:hypothetical protein
VNQVHTVGQPWVVMASLQISARLGDMTLQLVGQHHGVNGFKAQTGTDGPITRYIMSSEKENPSESLWAGQKCDKMCDKCVIKL